MSQNLDAFIAFYETVFGDAPTEYRLIKTREGRTVTRSRVSNPDDLDNDFNILSKLNNQGFNIYAVVNKVGTDTLGKIATGKGWHEFDTEGNIKTRVDGSPKRYYSAGDRHVEGIRALFVDLDEQPTGELTNLGLLQQAALPPSAIVQTSLSHKLQAYWLLEANAVTVAEFRQLQRQLVARFGGDKAVINPARVLRLAGFNHVKGAPIPTQLVDLDGSCYSRDELLKAFEFDPTPQQPQQPVNLDLSNATGDWRAVVEALAQWQPVKGELRKMTLLVVSLAYELGIDHKRAVDDVAAIKQQWHTIDPVESTQAVVSWVYGERAGEVDRATLTQLVGTMARDYGVTLDLQADKWARQCYAIAKKSQLNPQHFDHVIETNERYLSQSTLDRAVEAAGGRAVFVVESPVGSAKTTSLTQRFNGERSLLTLSPLQALCAQLAADSGSVNYLQQVSEPRQHYNEAHLIGDAPVGYEQRSAEFWRDYHTHDTQRLVVTPHSLPRLTHSNKGQGSQGRVYRHKHVIVDESDSCLNVLSDDSVDNEQSIYEALRGAMFGALSQDGSVWLSSAHHHAAELSLINNVVDAYEQTTGERVPIVLIKNNHKPNSGRTYEVIKAVDVNGKKQRNGLHAALLERVTERATDGARIALACDSDRAARRFYKQLKEKFSCLLIDAQTKGGQQQQQFINTRDPQQWQIIIYTPVLTSGFSVAAGHGFEVFGYSSARSVSPKGFEQLLGRFRDVNHYTLALNSFGTSKSQQPEDIKSELLQSEILNAKLLKQTLAGEMVWRDDGFADVHTQNIAHDRWQRSNWRVTLLALLEATGRAARQVAEVLVTTEATARYEATCEAVARAEAEDIANARKIDAVEAEAIEGKSAPTRADLLAIERYRFEQFYGVEATTEALLEDNNGRERAIVQRLMLARADTNTLNYLTEHNAARGQYSDGIATARSNAKLKHYAIKQLLYRAVLAGAAVDLNTLDSFASYHKAADSVRTLVNTLGKHYTAFKHELALPKRSDLQAEVTRLLARQLRELGFTTEGRQARDATGEPVRHYVAILNTDAYPHLVERLRQREQVVAAQVATWQNKHELSSQQPSLNDMPTTNVNCHSRSHLYKDIKRGDCDSYSSVRDGLNGTFENQFLQPSNQPKTTTAQPKKHPSKLPFDLQVAFTKALNKGIFNDIKPQYKQNIRCWLAEGNNTMLLKAYEAAPQDIKTRLTL